MKRNVLRGVLAVSMALGLMGVGSAANAVPDPASAVLTPASGPPTGGTEVTLKAPPGVTFTQVSAGTDHTVALAEDGTAYAWGYNRYGQLGNDTTASSLVPVRVQMPAGVTFAQVSAGTWYSVALATDGTAYAWGENYTGQLGNDTTAISLVPVRVQMPAGVTFTEVRSGNWYSVALATDGTAYAWGYNASGQLGNDTTAVSLAPVPVQMPAGVTFTQVSAGGKHSVALATDGTAYTWGDNFYGQLGNDTIASSLVPMRVQMPAGVTFTQASAVHLHSVALATDGTAYAWGENSAGQVGNDTTANSSVPVRVQMPGGVTFTQVRSGNGHSVALATDGTAYAWGYNASGQVGNDTTANSSVPVRVQMPGGATFTQVSAGGGHSVAIAADGLAYTWGDNGNGQLGDGTRTSRGVPRSVAMGVIVTEVAFGGALATGLVDNGDGTWTATTAPHAAGLVDVTLSWALRGVTQPDITHAGAFTYAVPDVAPTVTDPVDQAVTAGDTATFTVDVAGTPAPVVTWELSLNDGATWDAVTADDGTVSGDGKTLKVVATEALSGAQYRATATNSAGADTSAAATLTVVAVTDDTDGTDGTDGTDDPGSSGGGAEKGLARTGSQAAPPIAAAVLALLAGAGMVLAARREHA